jgi:hypothetical protein
MPLDSSCLAQKNSGARMSRRDLDSAVRVSEWRTDGLMNPDSEDQVSQVIRSKKQSLA